MNNITSALRIISSRKHKLQAIKPYRGENGNNSKDLPKAVYIATAGAIALTIDTTRLTTYIINDARLPVLLLRGLLIFVPASFLGAKIAKSVLDKIPQKYFRKVVAAFLLLMGLKLLLLPK